MKKVLSICLICIITIVIMYILELCNNYNFLSYVLGMMVGYISVILGHSVKD